MIAIVTESTAPVTRQEAEDLGVCVVSHSYLANGTAYLENYEDRNFNYPQRLIEAGDTASTGQSTSAAFSSVFRRLLSQGYDVLCIVISSRLSGAWSSAVTAAREVGSSKVAVIDSLSTAGGLYYQVVRARELADRGLSLAELADRCTEMRQSSGVAFSVENMSALRRSHRLGPLNQSVNTILNCRPVLLLKNGTIVYRGMARGKVNRIRMLTSMVSKDATQIMVQGFGGAPIETSLTRMLQRRFPNIKVQHRELGPVISIRIGAQGLSVSWRLD